MANRLAMLATMALASSGPAFADAPFATATFEREIEGSDKRVAISSATLDDRVCLVVKDVSTPNGDHSYRLVIYDGAGSEVYQGISRVTASGNKWSQVACFGYRKRRDVSGTWWYVAELDDQPLISEELKVAAGG
jgi:hypothetical protein